MASLNCLAELTYEECAALDKNNTIIILPMGPLEAHGPHLPLGVDIQGALILSEMGGSLLAARGMDIAIAPVIPYTLSDAAMPFSGTISLRRETVKVLLSDICASFLHHGFKYLVINCHHLERANMEALDQAALEIEKTGLSVLISRAIMESWAGLPNLLKGTPFLGFSRRRN